ncbi:MAG: uroporphyrinogen-III synthase [Cloacibacterium sp.]|jgi:uroporphyrinogen-III synthase|nr:uroporphyrinogen-III synthase [Cloacibacterium sp.]
MRILFTKKLEQREVSAILGNDAEWSFLEVIKINPQKINPFDLEKKTLVFTSENAVKYFFENQFVINENSLYCVGEKTAQLLEKNGFIVEHTAKNAKELARCLVERKIDDIFHFCGNLALSTLQEELGKEGLKYEKIEVYETELLYPKTDAVYQAIVFFSPSGVRSFAKQNTLYGAKIFSIGETTTKEIENFTQQKIFTSEANSLRHLLEIIKQEIVK